MKKKKYLCVWSDGFPNSYTDSILIVNEDHFTEEIGYSKKAITHILTLEVYESVGDDILDGGHGIMRVPDDFNRNNQILITDKVD